MKKHILFLAFICLSICSFGQLEQNQAIDSIFSEWNKPDSPGCALGIIKDGELIYSKGYGMANLEYDIPNSATSVFRIGSTSKQFTAACIVLLAEREKLSLDDNLKSLFPDFPDYAEKILIRHLLNHTSGIRDYLQIAYLKGYGNDDYYTDAEVMQWLINQSDLNFIPGSEFLYSNSGYWLLGQIVKKVSGMSMAEFAQREIFEPLEMKDTHFHNDHTQIVKNRASGYAPDGNRRYKISMTTLDMIGDGGIFTTINDIKKWDDAFYNSKVLRRNFWDVMTQKGVLNNGKTIDYASGLFIGKYKGLKTIRHGGAFVGFRAELLRFPEQHCTIAVFANRRDADPSRKAELVADVLLKDQLIEKEKESIKRLKNETPSVEYLLSQLTGNYELRPGAIFTLSIKEDTLNVVQIWNKSSYNIVKQRGNTYQIPGNEDILFTFSNLKDGHAHTLTILQGGRETKARRKREIDTIGIGLTEYAGSYFSEELDVTYIFEIDDEVLKVRIEDKSSTMDCTITEIDQFAMELGLVRFQRSNGSIIGFELDSGRVKNLKFRKE